MPYVTKRISLEMLAGGWRPNCHVCGRFVGEGGYYDVSWDSYNGAWEEGDSTCKAHTSAPRRYQQEVNGRNGCSPDHETSIDRSQERKNERDSQERQIAEATDS